MHLRCELRGHTEDVRGVCVCPLGIVSASRDKTVKIWKQHPDGEFSEDKTLLGHEDFVVAVLWIPAGALDAFPEGTIATGSKDKTVIIWDVENAVPAMRLEGHTQQITALGILSDATLVSSAVDGTLKLWRGERCVNTLVGHEGSVVSLLVLPEDHILSGSIDKTMRLWRNGSCVSVFSGHSDTVRCLTTAPELGIVSASHDKTLRLWSMDGDCLTVYEGHAEIVYSCTFSQDRRIASGLGSEDGTARLWNVNGKCSKSIYHPGCVWAVAFLPDNDLVTACSDGVVRVFSEDEHRLVPFSSCFPPQLPLSQASQEDRQCFEAAVSLRREELLASRKGTLPPGVNVEDPSVLYMPGLKDGETKIVTEGHGACAYSWSMADEEWKKLGDVLGTQPGELATASKFHDGQEWDFVFDVDFEDGAPMKKLCMNEDENPYEVAERFLLAEDLPIAYKDQVVQFIMNNTQMNASMSINADPLTGGGAYQPTPSAAPPPTNGLGAFGEAIHSLIGEMHRYVCLGEASITSMLRFSPMKNYVLFNVLKSAQPIGNKLREFNTQLKENDETQELALSDSEINGFISLLKKEEDDLSVENLNHVLDEVEKIAGGHRASLIQSDFDLLSKLMQFPHNKIFPVLDICRYLTLDPSFQDKLISLIGSDFNGVLANVMTALGPHQLSLYLLTNAYTQPKCRAELQGAFAKAMDQFKAATTAASKNARVGYASFVLNASVQIFMVGKVGVDSGKQEIFDTALSILDDSPREDSETIFRALVAVGTLLYDDSGLKRYARGTKLLTISASLKSHPGKPEKLTDALHDLDVILK